MAEKPNHRTPPFSRGAGVLVAALTGALVLLGGSYALGAAAAAPEQILCGPGISIELKPDHTWRCMDPTPTPSPSTSASASPTPTPSATVSPTPSPKPSVTPSPTPSPTPTPTPSPTGPPAGSCAAFPAMPGAACTGVPAGVVLHSCALEIRAAGTYDSCLFNGSVQIMTHGVTLSRSRVNGRVSDGGTGGLYDSGRNLVLVDVEINGTSDNDIASNAAIGQDGWSCLRCNIWGNPMGVRFGDNVTIRDSWLHDFRQINSGAHMSGAGNNGGAHDVIVHNVIDCPVLACSGALVMYGDFAQVTDILIQNNLFNSPGSYCLYAGSSATKPFPVSTNVRVIDNLWGRKYTPPDVPNLSGPRCGLYGPVSPGTFNPTPPAVWSGNRWQDGSGTINY